MSGWHSLDRHLRSEGFSQLLSAFLLLSLLTLTFSWSGNPLEANNSWYGLTALRRGALALMAVGLALRTFRAGPGVRLRTMAALSLISLLGAPLSAAGFAASYPATSLIPNIVLDTAFAAALYGFTTLVAAAAGRAFFLAVPAATLPIAASLLLDEATGNNLLFPFPLADGPVFLPALFWTAFALAFAAAWALALRRGGER